MTLLLSPPKHATLSAMRQEMAQRPGKPTQLQCRLYPLQAELVYFPLPKPRPHSEAGRTALLTVFGGGVNETVVTNCTHK